MHCDWDICGGVGLGSALQLGHWWWSCCFSSQNYFLHLPNRILSAFSVSKKLCRGRGGGLMGF